MCNYFWGIPLWSAATVEAFEEGRSKCAMRYFVLEHDSRISDIPYPKNFHKIIDVRKVSAEGGGQIPLRSLIQLQPSKTTVFPDVLCQPVILLTQDAKSVVDIFCEHIVYSQIVYLDQQHAQTQLYYMPMLETIDCNSPTSEFTNKGKGSFSKVVLLKNSIGGKTIFQVKNTTQRVIVIRLDLAENLLACGYRGFTLTEAEIET
jgi:hypothetical protein